MLKRRLKEPFGKAGLTVAVLALVMAMVGGAYAAGGLTKAQEKQVTKIAKKEARKFAGKPGAAGAVGPAGPAGAKGGAGTNGTNGTNGSAGTNGTNGRSVTVTSIPTEEPECAGQGGALLEAEGEPASASEVCNGQTGFTEALPSGKTETGGWAVNLEASETGETAVTHEEVNIPVSGFAPIQTAISFNIPLAAALAEAKVHYVLAAEWEGHTAPAECPGTVQSPTAEKGNLCVYELGRNSLKPAAEQAPFKTISLLSGQVIEGGADKTGALLTFLSTGSAPRYAYGSWAVTAP